MAIIEILWSLTRKARGTLPDAPVGRHPPSYTGTGRPNAVVFRCRGKLDAQALHRDFVKRSIAFNVEGFRLKVFPEEPSDPFLLL